MTKKRSQILLIVLCFLAYTLNYLTRYSYNANVVGIMSYYGVSKADAGLVNTLFFVAYGAGQFVHGAFCRHYPKKYVIPGALLVSSILNLVVFFRPAFWIYKWLWLFNGAVLSVLWPSSISLLGEVLEEGYLKKSIVAMGLTTSIGTCVIYGVSALCSQFGAMWLTFLFSALIGAAMALFYFFAYGPATSNRREEAPPQATEEAKQEAPTAKKPSRFLGALIALGFFELICNLVRDGCTTWVPTVLKERFSFPDSLSIALTIILPILGVFGLFFVLLLNKKVKDYTALCGIQYAIATLLLGIICLSLSNSQWLPMLLSFGLSSLIMHGINNTMTSIVPLQMRDRFEPGKLAGILNGCGYVGSALSSYGLGLLVDHTSWDFCFILLTCLTGLCVLIAFAFFFTKRKKAKGIR